MNQIAQPNLRAISLDIIYEVLEKNGYSNHLIDDVLKKYQYFDKKQRSFISRLSLGTIEHAVTIDAILNLYSKLPTNKMKPVLRNILRMSVYQMFYMSNTPDSAICNEAVKLASKRGYSSLKGFVNGVLRNILRNRERIMEEQLPSLLKATYYSMPQWIFDMWVETYDEQTAEKICASFLKIRKTSIRTNLSRITPEELKTKLEKEQVEVALVEDLPFAFFISEYDYLRHLQSFCDGDFYVQDISSMLVAVRAGIKENDKVLDMCAAPGGKSLQIADMLSEQGHITACDLSEYKVDILKDNMKRMQVCNMDACVWDAQVYDPEKENAFDVVICDLPCSGLGVIGRKPEIKYQQSMEQIKMLAELQKKILSNAVHYVKTGGHLVFSTCTITAIENEDNVTWLLQQFPYMESLTCEQRLPMSCQGDGFFISVFVKKQEER